MKNQDGPYYKKLGLVLFTKWDFLEIEDTLVPTKNGWD